MFDSATCQSRIRSDAVPLRDQPSGNRCTDRDICAVDRLASAVRILSWEYESV
jgi:hypothetical protein